MTINSPAVDIKDLLDDSSLFTAGTNLFVGRMPDSPDDAVCVFDTGGLSPSGMVDGDEYPRVMIHVRCSKLSYAEGYADCRSIITALHRKHNHWVDSSVRIISILSLNEPIFLGYDEKDRPTWSLNFQINRSV